MRHLVARTLALGTPRRLRRAPARARAGPRRPRAPPWRKASEDSHRVTTLFTARRGAAYLSREAVRGARAAEVAGLARRAAPAGLAPPAPRPLPRQHSPPPLQRSPCIHTTQSCAATTFVPLSKLTRIDSRESISLLYCGRSSETARSTNLIEISTNLSLTRLNR